MKRKVLEPGKKYVTRDGLVYEIISNEAGADVVDGEVVVNLQYARRYMGPVKGWAEYQSNTKISAYLCLPGKKKTPAAVEPRDFVKPYEEHKAEQEGRRETMERIVAEDKAWAKAFKERTGLNCEVDHERGLVTVTFRTLRRAGVTPKEI